MTSIILGVIFAGFLIYQANQLDLRGQRDDFRFSLALYALVIVGSLPGIYVLFLAANPSWNDPGFTVTIDLLTATIYFVLSFALSLAAILVIRYRGVRVWLAERQRAGSSLRYQPDSTVHTTAIVLAVFQIQNTWGGFLLTGGVEGLADEVSAANVTIETLLMSFVMYVLVALLGVGLYIRRNATQAIQRLGLAMPDGRAVGWGLAAGTLLFWFQAGMLIVWQSLVSPELLAEQTAAADQIFRLFGGSVWIALLMAVTTGIGEEILFRGALQPIFGNVAVSVFFASLHTQYLFTPAMFIILGVSLGFGWLRTRFDTTTAMIAHFIYNLIPFMLLWVLGS